MSRVLHDLIQGSPEWHAHRAEHLNASEAPAMQGVSPYLSRSELVRQRALGAEREVSPQEQARFDDGHAYEAMARPWAEQIVGESLFPITASREVEGLPLSASYDGATMGEDVIFEHKTLNQELAAALDRGEIPAHHKVQMEQQLLILGAEKCLFMASNGRVETMRHAWYTSNPDLRAAIIAGWRQFQEDVAAYQHVEVIPKAVAEPTMGLPAVAIEAKGDVTLTSNLEAFGVRLKAFIAELPAKPSTDQEFANCEAAVKALQIAQDRLEAAEAAALSRFVSIDQMRSTVAMYRELARTHRLAIEKLVKARKDEIRDEIRREGMDKYEAHVRSLNERLGRPLLTSAVIQAKFADVMKGKKTVTSLRDAVDTELARVKIEANAMADRLQVNLRLLEAHKAHAHLFPDAASIVFKAADDFAVLVKARIDDHKRQEAARLEAERNRIREEERVKAEAAAQAALDAAKPAEPLPFPEPRKPVPLPAEVGVSSGRLTTAAKGRPTNEQIVAAVAIHFSVPYDTAATWLREINLARVA